MAGEELFDLQPAQHQTMSWYSRFRANPDRFDYVQTLRYLNQHTAVRDSLKIIPQEIGFRCNWDIKAFNSADDRFQLIVNRPALTGFNGVLPHYLRDAIKHCSYDLDEPGLSAFFNIFNETALWLDYKTITKNFLPLMVEQAFRQKKPLPDHFANFLGLLGISSTERLWMLPYSLRSRIWTRSLHGIPILFSYSLGVQVTVECSGLNRWSIPATRRWHLSPDFKLGMNTLVGSFAWSQSEVISVVIHISNQRQWHNIEHHKNWKKLENLARVLLPYRFINYFVQLPEHMTKRPVISARQKSYRLSYFYSGNDTVPDGQVRVALSEGML